jgi:hypothetical protein
MDKVKPSSANKDLLKAYEAELTAERLYAAGDYARAAKTLQTLIDSKTVSQDDTAWYLQEMARYNYKGNRSESQRLQVAAHKANRRLLKPRSGVAVAKLSPISQGRVEAIHSWVGTFDGYPELDVALSDILSKIVFGTRFEPFEQALSELGTALGFASERPDKEWKEGPDNLWALDATHYLLWECKSEVDLSRSEINKSEAEQMSRSAAWFEKHYGAANVRRILIHPAGSVASAAAFTYETEVMREADLKRFIRAVRGFFKAFETLDFRSLSAAHTQSLINDHKLAVTDLFSLYAKKPRDLR